MRRSVPILMKQRLKTYAFPKVLLMIQNFLNAYLSRMGPIIRKHQGFIDKYIGDAIMAIFPGYAENAINAAIGMMTQLSDYNIQRQHSGYVPLVIVIGVHTGPIMLGTIGESERMTKTDLLKK
ncbi:MAG: adenylate/guanylate cyclase domain-containing protein [Desulfobacterales bacterium]|nr:adenylate/guanylate cyclase domain-containing protein [Desulfobacterales bacterium]